MDNKNARSAKTPKTPNGAAKAPDAGPAAKGAGHPAAAAPQTPDHQLRATTTTATPTPTATATPGDSTNLNLWPKSGEFVKCLTVFFQRDLIAMPIMKRVAHTQLARSCGRKIATIHLDSSSYPNLEYIAGNRLSVYPVNPVEHVNLALKHIVDDIYSSSSRYQLGREGSKSRSKSTTTSKQANPAVQRKQSRLSEPWDRFVLLNGVESLRLALAFVYDITTAPSRDLLRIMADCCSSREDRLRMASLSQSDEAWERWITSGLRTLKSTFEEFPTCKIGAKSLFSELTLQQPRQYSITSIKSSQRFRTELLVVEHKFTDKQIGLSLQNAKEREKEHSESTRHHAGQPPVASNTPNQGGHTAKQVQSGHATVVHVNHDDQRSEARSSNSVRSLRSVQVFGQSPISTQQVKRVPFYSGPLMSIYASNTSVADGVANSQLSGRAGSGRNEASTSTRQASQQANLVVAASQQLEASMLTQGKSQHEGLCSNFLLNAKLGDYVVCEFVENPRFTLKGNRERPIIMIGQDVGLLAFRTFWQQRAYEQDRAQMFYEMFKDLAQKKFGDMQLVVLSGHKCKLEDLYKREIQSAVTHRVISKANFINRTKLFNLLTSTTALENMDAMRSTLSSTQPHSSATDNNQNNINQTNNNNQNNLTTHKSVKSNLASKPLSREIAELGDRIAKLLIDSNGCIYTCCDPFITQAIDILIVESVAKNYPKFTRDQIASVMLPRWKAREARDQTEVRKQPIKLDMTYLFTLENQFERAQIVQEIYDPSI